MSQTQYLDVFNSGAVPQSSANNVDTVSYWDGDGIYWKCFWWRVAEVELIYANSEVCEENAIQGSSIS